ncbi:hypothetical protein BV25DRAFT_53734 [Artomyces pyxidatus]|uniref:Uncharacterized protein n=1 Tax=Artomyces pyxidatus TaxID=48021 RepID=A0ACB8TKA6_9AGAM|nr:hypothetical protein BV25DRAFT_53734 [Artomyces pyxidatus]
MLTTGLSYIVSSAMFSLSDGHSRGSSVESLPPSRHHYEALTLPTNRGDRIAMGFQTSELFRLADSVCLQDVRRNRNLSPRLRSFQFSLRYFVLPCFVLTL